MAFHELDSLVEINMDFLHTILPQLTPTDEFGMRQVQKCLESESSLRPIHVEETSFGTSLTFRLNVFVDPTNKNLYHISVLAKSPYTDEWLYYKQFTVPKNKRVTQWNDWLDWVYDQTHETVVGRSAIGRFPNVQEKFKVIREILTETTE
ncbi:MAG: hypothetical protein ACFFCQ_05340 [Promethearchaeota archaeon]